MSSATERERLEEDRLGVANWRRWGAYVSDRSWGTVREDYSHDGNAWRFLPHEHARSRAYRWGEDGLAGFCDRYQLLVFAVAFWNGRDTILKERLFGLIPDESNHGEDVKELYYYLDATPTHSYLKYLYKYPQARFPYEQLIAESSRRNRQQPEYELLDTGVFDEDRYFDIFVEYAKASPEDICIRIEAVNRGPKPAALHVLPHLWFRNTWDWGPVRGPCPEISFHEGYGGQPAYLLADDAGAEPLKNLLNPYSLGSRRLYFAAGGDPLFTNNDSHKSQLYGVRNSTPYVKDAFHRRLIGGEDCVNPHRRGTKACLHYDLGAIGPGESSVLRLRLTDGELADPISGIDAVVTARKQEADAFYDSVHPPHASEDERLVQRQALAGMIWSKQVYLFDVAKWLEGDNPLAPPPPRQHIRNEHWKHLNSMRILSMPDKWEYPWFAAWDLAFQAIPFALIDGEFAKEQLRLLLFEQFQHPNGQLPAYEWEFSDLNPPVHAWAVWRVYHMDRIRSGRADRVFLETCFHKLLMNFAWWVNKVDADGNNVFEGGFLGLDNITTFDRSELPADGARLKQADATGWMGMYCLNLMRIALELARENRTYEGLAIKFFEHYVYIGAAMKNMGGRSYRLWSEEDGLFYDVLCYPDGSHHRFRLRSLVSLMPLFAVERLEESWMEAFPEFRANVEWFQRNRSELTEPCASEHVNQQGPVTLLSLVNQEQLQRMLTVLWDPGEFRGPFGLRSLSKHHQAHPFSFGAQAVGYEPAESQTWLKGGNSNWRGPVWFPTSFLMIESLRKLRKVYGDQLAVTVNGETATLHDMAEGFANRLIAIFTRGGDRRPVFGGRDKLQRDAHFRDHLQFFEYFNAETGEGLGASHQTGWTGLVAVLIDEWRR